MKMNDVAIAIDLGGTNLRMAIVDESGKVIHWCQQATPGDRESIVRTIETFVGDGFGFSTTSGYGVVGVGVSTGGQVDFANGVIVDSTSLIAGWKNVPLRSALEEKFGHRVFVDNDGNCFALAEKHFGKGKGVANFIAMVLGTGIGGGICVDGKILRGSKNFAAEIGHVSIDFDGPVCSCGGRGCIELYASGSGIARWAAEEPALQHLRSDGMEFSSKVIGEAALNGDHAAFSLLAAAGERLGIAVAGLVNVFNPESIILSGSLIELEHPFLRQFRKTVMDVAMKSNSESLRIENSDFPKEGGILGAAALVFEEMAD